LRSAAEDARPAAPTTIGAQFNHSQGVFVLGAQRAPASGVAFDVCRAPVLEWLEPSDAVEGEEINLFGLLRWNHQLAETLYGREAELQNILAWVESGSKMTSARLVTGQAGSGKTRLAGEAARILRERGWTAGFLPRGEAMIEMPVAAGLLLIVDYPEERPAQTKALLEELAARPTAAFPLRILFLSRRSFAEWGAEAAILQGRFGRQHVASPAPLGVEEGERLIAEAARNFAACAKKPAPDLRGATAWLSASALHRLPLYATAAAIHAVLSQQDAFGLAGGELLKNLGLREMERVRRASVASKLGEKTLERLLALGVLADGLGEREVTALAAAGLCEASDGDIIGRLADCSWWRCGRLIRLEPDAPAAAFLDLALFGPQFPKGRDALPEWLFIALSDNTAGFGDRLSRVLYDLHLLDGPREGAHPLDERLQQMLQEQPVRAAHFSDVARSEISFWAANFAALVALILAHGVEEPELKAIFFANAAAYLSSLGRREEALAAAQDAVDFFRALAAARPDAFTPDLAMALNNSAKMLSDLGQREEALAAAQEAVDMRRAFAAARPDAFAPDLATSLNTLANMLSELGRREEALAAAQEAADMRRALTAACPDVFAPVLATSLSNLTNMLSDLGRREEALLAAQEALNIRRALAAARPDTFTPDLAGSLNNLAPMLSDLGRREEALAAAHESADLYRALATARSDAFTPDLAMALNNLAKMLFDLGRREEALAAAQESVDFYRTLATTRPEAFSPALAVSLNTLGGVWSGLGRREEALAAAQETVDMRRALAAARPEAFMPDLAMALNNLAKMLFDLGRREEALAAAQEAVAMRRALAAARPDAFTPGLANSLDNLANIMSALGRREEALAAAHESVDFYRALAAARPDAFTPYLAGSLNTLAGVLSGLRRWEDALKAARESADFYRALAAARPDAFARELLISLSNFAALLSDLGRRDEALAAEMEAADFSASHRAPEPLT